MNRSRSDLVLEDREHDGRPATAQLTFIGTATALIEWSGLTILTGPNFLHQGDHAPLGYGLSSKRLTEPAMDLDELPPVDFVVLSHHHGDHFDPLVVERLSTDLPIITEPPSAPKLVRQGFRRAIPVQTWSSTTVRRGDTWIRITSLPAKHAPQPLRLLLPKVMGSMLECGTGDGDVSFRLYITGTRSTTRTWSRSVIGIPTSTCV